MGSIYYNYYGYPVITNIITIQQNPMPMPQPCPQVQQRPQCPPGCVPAF